MHKAIAKPAEFRVTYYNSMGKFSENLRKIMLDRGMTQVDLAKKSGVKQPLISNYLNESKSAKMPSIQTLISLATALRCTPNDLLGWPEEKPFPYRSIAAWQAFLDLPSEDPRRKAIEVLLGIDSIDDSKESGEQQ